MLTLSPEILEGDLGVLIDEANARAECNTDLSIVLQNIPLDLFAVMQVHRDRLPESLKLRIPPLPTRPEQLTWTGSSGLPLMLQTSDYAKLISNRYLRERGNPLRDIRFLDYGCGWGRVMRFMAALVRNENIYGVDPLQMSLDICKRDGVPGKVMPCELLPVHGVDLGIRFDLINCFSVFTHLPEESHGIVLAAIRDLVADDGVVFLSIRSSRYWQHMRPHLGPAAVAQKLVEHEQRGFSFWPGGNKSDLLGTFGDATISLNHVRKHWTRWNVEAVEFSHYQPNQLVLCLSPRQ